jgi:hypothetical protein
VLRELSRLKGKRERMLAALGAVADILKPGNSAKPA